MNHLKSYQALLNSNTALYIQSHGQTGTFALGFHGPDVEINKWYNLFCNMDTRPRDEWGDFPKSPRLVYIGPSLAYINITKERLRSTLILYFSVTIPLVKDIETKYYYDETTEIETWERDEELLNKMAEEAADHFIANEIKVHCFVPRATNDVLNELSAIIAQNEDEHNTFRKIVLKTS